MVKSVICRAACLLAVLGVAPPSYGQERLQFDRHTPVVKVYERTHKAVVNVSGEQTGTQPGDLLLQVNDATVRNLEEFSLEMEKVTEGDTVEFKILRISIGMFGQIERRLLVRFPARALKANQASL